MHRPVGRPHPTEIGHGEANRLAVRARPQVLAAAGNSGAIALSADAPPLGMVPGVGDRGGVVPRRQRSHHACSTSVPHMGSFRDDPTSGHQRRSHENSDTRRSRVALKLLPGPLELPSELADSARGDVEPLSDLAGRIANGQGFGDAAISWGL